MDDEPDVPRVWLPDQDAPGLAMARAFGDLCLKDHGLICTPEVYYRKLSEEDEFLVLATDGVRLTVSDFCCFRVSFLSL
jgi:serine/threonine protein phosphatase PrpC